MSPEDDTIPRAAATYGDVDDGDVAPAEDATVPRATVVDDDMDTNRAVVAPIPPASNPRNFQPAWMPSKTKKWHRRHANSHSASVKSS